MWFHGLKKPNLRAWPNFRALFTTDISNLKYIWAHRPSIKGTKLLFIVIKAIIIIRLSNPHWQNTTVCQKKKTSKSETAWPVEDTKELYSHLSFIYRKRFDFVSDHTGKIPSISPLYPSKRPFGENAYTLVPIFGRPHSCPCIQIKQMIDLSISKFYISHMPRILPSDKYFIKKSSFKNAILLVKRPFTFATFVPY